MAFPSFYQICIENQGEGRLKSFVDVHQCALSCLANLRNQVASCESHIATLKGELSAACRRQIAEVSANFSLAFQEQVLQEQANALARFHRSVVPEYSRISPLENTRD